MELTEKVETINQRLADYFGIDTVSGQQMWRIVWSEDQFEKRFGEYEDRSPEGLFIRRVREVREVPKYRQYIDHKYVLEHLVVVPDINIPELPTVKVSYEPIWVFEDRNGFPLPPKWEASQYIINTVHAAMGKPGANLKKYIDPDEDPQNKISRVNQLVDELFGDQSSLQGTTKTGETIIVPRNYQKEN